MTQNRVDGRCQFSSKFGPGDVVRHRLGTIGIVRTVTFGPGNHPFYECDWQSSMDDVSKVSWDQLNKDGVLEALLEPEIAAIPSRESRSVGFLPEPGKA